MPEPATRRELWDMANEAALDGLDFLMQALGQMITDAMERELDERERRKSGKTVPASR